MVRLLPLNMDNWYSSLHHNTEQLFSPPQYSNVNSSRQQMLKRILGRNHFKTKNNLSKCAITPVNIQ